MICEPNYQDPADDLTRRKPTRVIGTRKRWRKCGNAKMGLREKDLPGARGFTVRSWCSQGLTRKWLEEKTRKFGESQWKGAIKLRGRIESYSESGKKHVKYSRFWVLTNNTSFLNYFLSTVARGHEQWLLIELLMDSLIIIDNNDNSKIVLIQHQGGLNMYSSIKTICNGKTRKSF